MSWEANIRGHKNLKGYSTILHSREPLPVAFGPCWSFKECASPRIVYLFFFYFLGWSRQSFSSSESTGLRHNGDYYLVTFRYFIVKIFRNATLCRPEPQVERPKKCVGLGLTQNDDWRGNPETNPQTQVLDDWDNCHHALYLHTWLL